MHAISKKVLAVAAAAILLVVLSAVPAQAAGARSDVEGAAGPAPLATVWDLGSRLLEWLGLGPAEAAGAGLGRITAAGGGTMDPDGTPTAAGGVGMDPDGSPTAPGGGGMDPDG